MIYPASLTCDMAAWSAASMYAWGHNAQNRHPASLLPSPGRHKPRLTTNLLQTCVAAASPAPLPREHINTEQAKHVGHKVLTNNHPCRQNPLQQLKPPAAAVTRVRSPPCFALQRSSHKHRNRCAGKTCAAQHHESTSADPQAALGHTPCPSTQTQRQEGIKDRTAGHPNPCSSGGTKPPPMLGGRDGIIAGA
jgi:hypothetical protein